MLQEELKVITYHNDTNKLFYRR